MAIGDAFGARFENRSPAAISLDGEENTYLGKNRYTDDTQMAIGIGELLLSSSPLTREHIAGSLLTAYRRDPRPGYSALTRAMLEESPDAASFLVSLSPDEISARKSDGAAMRALPIGLLPDRGDVIRIAARSAAITHGHPDAIAATVGVALIAHDRYYSAAPFPIIIRSLPATIPCLSRDARQYLEAVIGKGYHPGTILGQYATTGVPYTESLILLAAVMAVLVAYGTSPRKVLTRSVRLGGDTDTTACIALAASLIWPDESWIPAALITELENGPYGRDFLLSLGDRLGRKFPVRRAGETTPPSSG